MVASTPLPDVDRLPIHVHVWGQAASFTRYDTPAEADTYPMLTPVAADGVLTSIYWRPGLTYEIRCIDLLRPVQLYSRSSTDLARVPGRQGLDVSSSRTPRSRRFIHRPAYVIHARMSFQAGEDHGQLLRQHLGRFQERLARGQVYEQPYFGLRELTCHAERAIPGALVPCPVDADLGPLPLVLAQVPDPEGPVMLTRHAYNAGTGRWDRVRERGRVEPQYFDAQVRGGQLLIPPYRSVPG